MLFSMFSRKGMSSCATRRTQAITRHIMTNSGTHEQPLVLFESQLSVRTFKLNRPAKLNSLNESMIGLLQSKIEFWRNSELCSVIWGSGEGRAFCAGGDVETVVQNASSPETRNKAIEFFNKEFALDYLLSTLDKPYIAIMDGITMGGGVGLSAPASFRVATEKTVFAMPETKIGYCPDVGASHYLSRLDGELGTYLALTGDILTGRAVYEHGLATHYIPSRRVPILLESISALDNPTFDQVNDIIEEHRSEPEQPDTFASPLVGPVRAALDFAFRQDNVEGIVQDLDALVEHRDPSISQWASKTLESLHLRSPTSLKVALRAIRHGKTQSVIEALKMEYRIAAALCNGASPDFEAGVKSVLMEKKKNQRPNWSPATLEEVTDGILDMFFRADSPHLESVPEFKYSFAPGESRDYMEYALPTEYAIRDMVTGEHPNGGDTGITIDELVSSFENITDSKMGVREKVQEVAARRCELIDNADGNRVWLKWAHNVKLPE
ncbi:3-hydroxyisobutyryl-coenzyme A hydrolase [Lentinula aciculospora]|uniref:3-hydroxyisobutyryl-CoA hydrolase n=1 Tax=Lentinula aciculospora TaxID=153920 RepID=A0A9W9A948_9AGAR|nr:3-hydroxyisobutyryl-coenzyme A hydrolase [Lentinula aciculospora]